MGVILKLPQNLGQPSEFCGPRRAWPRRALVVGVGEAEASISAWIDKKVQWYFKLLNKYNGLVSPYINSFDYIEWLSLNPSPSICMAAIKTVRHADPAR